MSLRWPALPQNPCPFTECQRVKLVLITGRLDQGRGLFTECLPVQSRTELTEMLSHKLCSIIAQNTLGEDTKEREQSFSSLNSTNYLSPDLESGVLIVSSYGSSKIKKSSFLYKLHSHVSLHCPHSFLISDTYYCHLCLMENNTLPTTSISLNHPLKHGCTRSICSMYFGCILFALLWQNNNIWSKQERHKQHWNHKGS